MHPMPGTTWGHATQKTKWSGRPLRGSLPAEMCAHLHLLPASSWLLVWKDTDAHEPHWTLRCLGSELRMPKLQDGILGSDDTMRLPCTQHCQHLDFLDEREKSASLWWNRSYRGPAVVCYGAQLSLVCHPLSIGLFSVCKTPGSSCWIPQLPLPILPPPPSTVVLPENILIDPPNPLGWQQNEGIVSKCLHPHILQHRPPSPPLLCSKYGPGSNFNSITWEFVGKTDSQAYPSLMNQSLNFDKILGNVSISITAWETLMSPSSSHTVAHLRPQTGRCRLWLHPLPSPGSPTLCRSLLQL